MQEELSEVVNAVGDKSGNGEVKGTISAVIWSEVFELDTGEEEEGVFVVSCEVLGCLIKLLVSEILRPRWDGESYLVVGGVFAVEVGVDDGFDKVKGVQQTFAFIQ
jgi:hypothetical protein